MEQICPNEICTGCALCSAQCPVSCITMVPNRMGHLHPKIDKNSCIDCGLCKQKCPALSAISSSVPSKAYAVWAKDIEEYKTSTSGGAAAVLSNFIIASGGTVYGCAMLSDIDVKHIRVENASDLWKLKGSKYVQSNIKDIVPALKEDIKNGRKVLFIGTPCQTAAIKNIYKSTPENLYLIDIVCHGTPSLIFLQKHIKKITPSDHYDNVKFRDDDGCIIAVSVNNKEVYKTVLFKERFKDLYLNTFFDGFSYRDACYTCKYAGKNRISDLTIGDFWGLGAMYPDDEIPTHDYGCSAVLVNNEKGYGLLKGVIGNLNIYERPVEECINGNEQLCRPKKLGIRIKVYRAINKLIYAPKAYYLVNFDLIMKNKLRNLFK